MQQPTFFRPEGAWVGDVIPYVEDEIFRLFYLYEVREDPKPGTPWHLVTTENLVDFDDHGVGFEQGSKSSPDFNVYTGSIVRDWDDVHHLFYTGQNPDSVGADGLPLQLVMHATSADGMTTWKKHPEHTFGAPDVYDSADWRDPFIFHDEQAGIWRMLITARHTDGPERRRGVIAQCVSTDLVHWEITDPFWDPRRYIAHECPEVFRWGSWWYLVYSEFSEGFTTRYRMSKSLEGPWLVPDYDTIDGRAFYAAKSAGQDGRRFFFGWIASKEGDCDDGPWQWAGTLSVLEANQNNDGSLSFGFSTELIESFAEDFPTEFEGQDRADLPLELEAADGYRCVVSQTVLPNQFHASVTFDISTGTTECGVLLRAGDDGDQAYIIRLEPKRGRLVFDRWPRFRTGNEQWQISGDVPHAVELERPCDIPPGEHTLDIIVDGDICVANLDRRTSLSTRIYDRTNGRLGLFVGEGKAIVSKCHLAVRPPLPDATDSLIQHADTDNDHLHEYAQ